MGVPGLSPGTTCAKQRRGPRQPLAGVTTPLHLRQTDRSRDLAHGRTGRSACEASIARLPNRGLQNPCIPTSGLRRSIHWHDSRHWVGSRRSLPRRGRPLSVLNGPTPRQRPRIDDETLSRRSPGRCSACTCEGVVRGHRQHERGISAFSPSESLDGKELLQTATESLPIGRQREPPTLRTTDTARELPGNSRSALYA